MRQTKVAQRYAKALFDFALEKGNLDDVKADLDAIHKVDHKELTLFLMSPVVAGEKKTAIFEAIFSKYVQEVTIAFFKLIFLKGRSIAIDEIIEAFNNMFRQHKGIQIVEITTAVAVSDDVKATISKVLSGSTILKNKSIELKENVDPSIIGGLIVQVEDQFFDASIRHDLQAIKKQFVKNMYVQEIR